MKPKLNDRVKIRNTFLGFVRALSGTDETALIEQAPANPKDTKPTGKWQGWVPFAELVLAPVPEESAKEE